MRSTVVKKNEIEFLNKAFASFNESTNELKKSYDSLQEKIERLDIQLESKNKELEISLREKENAKNHLKNILESLTVGVVVVGLNENIDVFNKAAERITGYSSDKATGKNFFRFFNRTLRLNPPLKKEETCSKEAVLIKDKESQLFVSLNSTYLKDSDGKIIGKIIIAQDITQLKKLKEQAERRNSLTAMGELAVDIAHEIRNPLGSIELFASLLKRELNDSPENLRLAEHISSSVKSLNHILSNLLLFTKTQRPVFSEIDIHAFLKNTTSFISYILGQNNIRLEKKFDVKDTLIKGDGELLKQVFFNLTLNAVQAMPDGGVLTISTGTITDEYGMEKNEKNCAKKSNDEERAARLEIKIKDTGTGIPEGYIKTIFNPFFTTRERGTGLGLAIVHNIIESHNGIISVESKEGRGTEFSLIFPVERFKEERSERSLESSNLIELGNQ